MFFKANIPLPARAVALINFLRSIGRMGSMGPQKRIAIDTAQIEKKQSQVSERKLNETLKENEILSFK